MVDSGQPSAPPAAPPPENLGELLRSARLEHDLTLEQLSTELRIEVKQLNALEENRFEQIGVPVFVKGYLKQYGLRLGLDVRDLLALYYKQTTLPDIEIQPSRTIKLRDERQITSWILAALVLVTVVVGLAVWWWNGGSFGSVAVPSSADPPAELPAESSPVPASLPSAPSPAPVPPPESAAPVLGEPPAGAAPAAPTPEPAAEGVEATAESDEARAASTTLPLELAFDAESWAEVTDARGERLLFGLNAAGRNVTVRGEPPFSVVLGNADAVRLTVDGEPYDIPRAGRQGSLARFAVDIAEE